LISPTSLPPYPGMGGGVEETPPLTAEQRTRAVDFASRLLVAGSPDAAAAEHALPPGAPQGTSRPPPIRPTPAQQFILEPCFSGGGGGLHCHLRWCEPRGCPPSRTSTFLACLTFAACLSDRPPGGRQPSFPPFCSPLHPISFPPFRCRGPRRCSALCRGLCERTTDLPFFGQPPPSSIPKPPLRTKWSPLGRINPYLLCNSVCNGAPEPGPRTSRSEYQCQTLICPLSGKGVVPFVVAIFSTPAPHLRFFSQTKRFHTVS